MRVLPNLIGEVEQKGTDMWELSVTSSEVDSIHSLLRSITSEHESAEDGEFLRKASVYAHELPRRVRAFLNDFRLLEPLSGVCVISGYPVNDVKIGSTPAHWKWKSDAACSIEEQILFVLYGCLLGDPFAWVTQQGGFLVHDVLPIERNKDEQLSTGCAQTLWWHTEDAFHPYRADYVGLMCLRNTDRVATTVGVPDIARLDKEQYEILFEPRFMIRPDESHSEKNESDLRKMERMQGDNDVIGSAYEKIKKLTTEPQKFPILFGDPTSPYFRLDPYFTAPLDDRASDALNALARTVDENLHEIILDSGDCCFIDNYRVVHGRKAFEARFDGTDRWLKRINLTRDLRKSQDARADGSARLLL
jgi:Fe(II)/alpha-ketoglutarate-dependent arginine beta-hydroxylase